MHYIPEAASGIKDTAEQKTVEDSIDALIKRTTLLKQTRQDYLKRITTKRNDGIQLINERMQAIRKRLDELKEKAIAEVEETFIEREETVITEISKTADVISKLKDEEKLLKAAQWDESTLFIYVKQGKVRERESKELVQELEKSVCSGLMDVVVDDTVVACMTGLESFACIRPAVSESLEQKKNKSVFSLSLEQQPYVRTDKDMEVCEISDCCLLGNGNILMADEKNECVKLFDPSYKVLDRCTQYDIPSAACSVGDCEVAIALFNSQAIQFATVDQKICPTRSLPVGESIRGMSYASERLYVSCGGQCAEGEGPGQVRIFDLDGSLMQTIKPNGPRECTFSIPMHIIMSMNGNCIVANYRKGIIAFDKGGKVMWSFQDCNLLKAVGICEIDDGTVLVGCINNGDVFEVVKTDQRSRIVLHGSDILDRPLSLTYDKCNGKLIITKKGSDHVLVYKVR